MHIIKDDVYTELVNLCSKYGNAPKLVKTSSAFLYFVRGKIMEENYKKTTEKEILAVSFGTSYNDSREKTIGAIELELIKEYPDYEVCRAFTSQVIIDKLRKRDGTKINNVTEALEEAFLKGVKELIIQPTHLLNGYEYMDLADEVKKYKDKFEKLSLAKPLLTDESDFVKVADAIIKMTEVYNKYDTAVCFMGHGTGAAANDVYEKLQYMLFERGYKNYYIGTVEAKPDIDDLIKCVKKGSYGEVVLLPLMIVAGDHANNDMAGNDKESWKKRFEEEGYKVTCILNGLGENSDIRKIFTEHTYSAIRSFKD